MSQVSSESNHLSEVPAMNQNTVFEDTHFGKLKAVYSCRLGHLYVTSDCDKTLMMPAHKWPARIAETRELAEQLIGEDVVVTLSQTAEPWEPQKWLYRVRKVA